MEIKTIYHVGAWNRNIGDWAACYNLHRLIELESSRRNICVRFVPIDSQRGVFHDDLVDCINSNGDMLLLGPGGMIFNRPLDQSVSGWAFSISEESIQRLKVPIVVYGIGYNKFYFDRSEWPDYMASHIRTLSEVAQIFSTRDEGSKAMISEEFGVPKDKIKVVPDTGLYAFDEPITIPGLDDSKIKIGINWAGDRPEERFPIPYEKTQKYFIEEVARALEVMVRSKDYQIVFIPHLQDVDVSIREDIFAPIQQDVLDIYELLPHLYPPAGENLYVHVPFYLNLYRQLDLTLGMRGHSCIFSFGVSTKFIPFGSHNKLQYFIGDLNIPNHSYRMTDTSDDSDVLLKVVDECLNDTDYDSMADESLTSAKSKIDMMNQELVGYLQ